MLTQYKIKKKKQREREVKKKLQRRRDAKQRAVSNIKRLERDFEKSRNVVLKMTPAERADHDKTIKEKLAHNLEILKALEEEYDAEKKSREELNKKLEDEGCETAQEKLEALQKMSKAAMKERNEEDAALVELVDKHINVAKQDGSWLKAESGLVPQT